MRAKFMDWLNSEQKEAKMEVTTEDGLTLSFIVTEREDGSCRVVIDSHDDTGTRNYDGFTEVCFDRDFSTNKPLVDFVAGKRESI